MIPLWGGSFLTVSLPIDALDHDDCWALRMHDITVLGEARGYLAGAAFMTVIWTRVIPFRSCLW